jgi:hypothetical protein
VLRNAPQGRNIQNRVPRPYDLHSAQIKKSDDLDNARAKINAFWHKRLQCKSYQRSRSAAGAAPPLSNAKATTEDSTAIPPAAAVGG